MKTVIFDLDGTLADTSRDLINAANHCFRGLGLGDVLSHPEDAPTAMRGGKAMLTLGFGRTKTHGAEEIDRQYPILLDAYGSDLSRYSHFFPGALAAVERLRQIGFATGICTNKPEVLAERLMQDLGARHKFGALVGADTLPVRKPDPTPFFEAVERAGGSRSQSLLVGDTATDRETARAAGVPSVLVTFGPMGRAVEELEPDALLDDYAELPELAQKLLG